MHVGSRIEGNQCGFVQRVATGYELDSKHRMLGDAPEPTSLQGRLRITTGAGLIIVPAAVLASPQLRYGLGELAVYR